MWYAIFHSGDQASVGRVSRHGSYSLRRPTRREVVSGRVVHRANIYQGDAILPSLFGDVECRRGADSGQV